MKNSETTAISLRRISFCREDVPLFQQLNLDVNKGQWVSIRGKNGAGKSTLLNLMAGLLVPDEGEILICPSTPIAFVGHQNGQQSHLSLRNQLEAKRIFLGSSIEVDWVLETCGLSFLANEKIGHLSAGQQRQGALAALLFTPQSLWLLDEPFEHLDLASKTRFMGIFTTFVQQGGTICQTSHEDFPASLVIQEYWLSEQRQQTEVYLS